MRCKLSHIIQFRVGANWFQILPRPPRRTKTLRSKSMETRLTISEQDFHNIISKFYVICHLFTVVKWSQMFMEFNCIENIKI